jgi:hypothetical protein
MQTQGQEFEVYVRSNSSTAEEWKRAMEAPTSELPPLNEEQKEIVKRFGITEEEYARGELAGVYGQERLKAKGAQLGSVVVDVLNKLSEPYRLLAVLYEGGRLRWIVRVETPRGIRNVGLPYELVDDVVDSELFESRQQLTDRLSAAASE